MKKFFLLSVILCFIPTLIHAQGLKGLKLQNGLTVYIWEDSSKPDVFGMVGVNVGSSSDPENLTGLAHYLEHVMFKGTEKIGTVDWEKERPLYEQIIAKYDEMAATDDATQKEILAKEINKLSIEAAQYMAPNEFSSLTEELGGYGLNAGTSWDYTVYYNSFPPSEIYRWLELNSERFINPVFRAFQSELETVYEEFNRYEDQQGSQVQNFILKNIFPGHPYSRPIIGKQEHLKNPKLSSLIDFYNEWYVPENMVLVLVGNIKTSQVQALIQDKFGRLPAKKSPERKTYPDWDIKGRKSVSAKLTPYPQIQLAFQGIPNGHPDDIALDICMSLLSNSSRTGLLDKLVLEGDLMTAFSGVNSFRDQGRIVVGAVPYFDINQRRFNSLKDTEKIIRKEIKKLQDGNIEEWLLQSIKETEIRQFDLLFESSATKANLLVSAFMNNEDIGEILAYKDRVAAITLDNIKTIAKKYLTNDFIAIELQEGKAPKSTKLDKPQYDPIIPSRDAESAYAANFSNLPVMKKAPEFANLEDVKSKKINDLSKLFYTKNEENEIYTLTLKYGVGTAQMPKLRYAVQLMNNAGVMGQFEPQELKQEFSKLGTSCRFRVDDSYLYVVMEGYESTLQESCNLLTRQILMPKLEEKQLNSIIGSQMQSRRVEKDYTDILKDALFEYLFYQDKSEYIDRLPIEDIRSMSVSHLTGEFSRATDYEAEIHYVGNMSFDDAYEILSNNLPLKAQEKPSTSPEVKEVVQYNENTVYFLPDNDAQQSAIYFLINGKPYHIKDKIAINAFNQYFSGSFNGLVMKEVREYRSMAYTAYGRFVTPPIQQKNIYMDGFIGTQSDKTIDAIELYLSLLKEMPEYPNRIENIKGFLYKVMLTTKPSFRNASQRYEAWRKLGYTEDPAKTELSVIENLTFEDLMQFYHTEIKNKPIAIAIIGDPKQIDTKELEKFGKVIRLNKAKLFSTK
ncbi:insulinase family protein [Parabacteroides sp. 52]|uniref:M16 family metallopeptidase n=1 Tax=unclassified Parabacteroides TaxID=2649774 RepID=UPI0013D33A0D|nr:MULTISPECIES: insulinase family protein [unclassified Parabacteroides]MDH6533910.1 zinc protease [Parabacteroides sp. PM5-20]NDV54655.1 insulinase family protein [Parabacteroides sp. 52]